MAASNRSLEKHNVALRRGVFIAIESIDGSGKKTQADMLRQYLEKKGEKVRLVSYPDYKSAFGKLIEKFLQGELRLDPTQQFILYLLDMLKDRVYIEQELSKGATVIADRYFFSTIAYQCAGGFNYIAANLLVYLLGLPLPDIVIFIDMDPEEGIKRKIKAGYSLDIFESNLAFLKNVLQVYKRIIADNFFGVEWIIVDGSLPIEHVHHEIINKLGITLDSFREDYLLERKINSMLKLMLLSSEVLKEVAKSITPDILKSLAKKEYTDKEILEKQCEISRKVANLVEKYSSEVKDLLRLFKKNIGLTYCDSFRIKAEGLNDEEI